MVERPAPLNPPFESVPAMVARTVWHDYTDRLVASVVVPRSFETCYPAAVQSWFGLVHALMVDRTGVSEVVWGVARDGAVAVPEHVCWFVEARPDPAGVLFRRLSEEMGP